MLTDPFRVKLIVNYNYSIDSNYFYWLFLSICSWSRKKLFIYFSTKVQTQSSYFHCLLNFFFLQRCFFAGTVLWSTWAILCKQNYLNFTFFVCEIHYKAVIFLSFFVFIELKTAKYLIRRDIKDKYLIERIFIYLTILY